MGNRIDDAITLYAQEREEPALLNLQMTFMSESLYVPIATSVKKLQPGHFDVPVVCVRTESGEGAIPVFTTLEHLFEWKPIGCLYTTLTGQALLSMAVSMNEIAEILVNMNGAPRGRIPRSDFEKMLALK